RAWPAALAGLIFGVHPLTVEPIPWVGERKTLLATFFSLASMVCYVLYVRRRSRGGYVASLAFYLLALMSKPTRPPPPVLLVLLDFWPLRRLSRRTVLEKTPFFIIALGFAVITYYSQKLTASVKLPGEDSGHVVLIVCHNIVFYLRKFVWPSGLTSHYP